MAGLVCILVTGCVLLLVQLIRYERELDAIERQLSFLEEGSRIEVTTGLRSRKFLKLCRRLNRIMEERQKEDRQLRQSRNQLKQTVSNIAHDIRTPLTAASGYLQMLKEGESAEQKERYIRIIENRLLVLKDMLEELFLHTKLVDEEYVLTCLPLEIYPLLCDSLLGFYQNFEEAGMEPEVIFENEQVRFTGNQEGFHRVFRNLIQNAVLHGSGGLLIIQREGEILFKNPVRPGQIQNPEQLFDRFYKEDISRKKGSSGLGLAIVRELSERMGGSAEALLEGDALVIRLRFREVHDT